MKLYCYFLFTIFIILVSKQGQAQLTEVHGVVIDKESKEVLPSVNFILQNTSAAFTSRESGKYSVQSTLPADSLTVSATGYKKQTLFIKRNKKQRLTIELEKIHFNTKDNASQKEKDYVLQLLDSVMAHKEQNNNSSLKKYCWEMYDKFQIYLGNYSSEIKELGAFQKHNHLFKYTDTINGHPLIPIYMSESIYKKFVDRSLSLNEQILIARKSTGKNYENLTTMTDKLLENINVYEDYFQILDKSFVSPLVTNYSLFYKYKLIGKTVLKKNIFYSIQFEPYRKEDFAFSGTLLIDGKTWAIKKVDMETAESINLNYVKTLHIQQKYKFIQNKWIVNKFETWATLSALKWQKGEDLIVHRYTSFEDIIIDNSQVIKKEYTAALINRTHGEEIQSELFWKRNRHQPLGKKEKYNYAIADTINHVPFIEKAKRISTIAISGYMELGKISLYQLNTFYSINPIENHRIKFGLITNKYFSEKLQLQGYIAYGTGDKEIKYKGGVLYVLNKSVDRLLLGATYKYDLELSGVSPSHIPFDNVITSFTSINKKVKLIFAREARIFIEKEWIKGVSSKLTFVNKEMRPLGDITFEKNIENSVIPKQIHDITISEIQINSRFSYKEKFYINEFKRISLGSRYPIFMVDLILGAKNVLHSDYSYQKIKTNVLGKFYINPFGYIYYNLEGGKIMGTVPFLLATLHPANQSLAYDVEGFNAMRYFEFASDTYASLFLDHHFDGFFLNKIPLVKKAKLREVVSARGVIGTLSTKNKEEMVLPEGMSDVRKPYVEYSVGLENILKVLRVEYIWRGTHMSPVSRSDNWAIKARFFLAF